MRTTSGSTSIGRLTGRILALVAAAFLVSACGANATPAPSKGPPAASATSPASPPPTGGTAGMPGCPNFVEVVETGPMPGDNGAEDGPVAREQARLTRDAEAVQEYGAAHPDEFASLRFENGPRVRLVIAFTDHIAEHCAALRDLLAFPDEFELIRADRTEGDLEAIQQEIVNRAQPFIVSTSSGGATGVVEVVLRANGEGMARQIVEEYGDAVHVTVGLLSYPDRTRADGLTTCGPANGTLRLDAPLRGTLVRESLSVMSGADFKGTVRVVNVGVADFAFESGSPATALVYAPGATEAIGTYAGGIDGVGLSQVLGPRDAIDIDLRGGTASCDPALGYALPPGQYDVRAVIDVYTMHDNAPTEIEYILSDPAPLTIGP
jgi:hypothetical protein